MVMANITAPIPKMLSQRALPTAEVGSVSGPRPSLCEVDPLELRVPDPPDTGSFCDLGGLRLFDLGIFGFSSDEDNLLALGNENISATT